jgi:hypothetical protein
VLGKAAGATLAVCALLALAGRWISRRVFLPWLRETLIDPIKATQHQVTANSHQSDVPTVPDLLHTLSDQVVAMDDTFSQHVGQSVQEWARLDVRVSELERINRERNEQ